MTEISKEVIKAYALENALKHGGKANPSSVLAGLFAAGLEKSQIKDYMPKIQEVLENVNSMKSEEQKKDFESLKDKVSKREIREGLPPLPNAEKKKIVMRFAPFPSGPLHIGNARALILNDQYVKDYEGKLLLVMDDTIGSEEKPIEKDAYKLIEDGVRWLEVKYDKKIIYKSDRLETYYAYAKEMINKGYMYVCHCSRDEIRELRVKGIECSCRQFSGAEQIKRWEKMFTSKEGTACVRLKTNMSDPDPAFRDRVMFRISDRPHARVGTKYRIYPMLDFSWAIDDHSLGITHILRGMELAMETRVEKFIWDIFGWKHPEVIYNGHFAIEGIKISKSKGAREVRAGTYFGWNDPRTWSLQSLKKRGISPEAIREFILNMGIRKTNIKIPIDVLYSLNRKYIGNSKRYFFVESPQKIKINGCPEIDARIPFSSDEKNKSRTYKTSQEFLISKIDFEMMEDKNYRLMHLLNFKSDKTIRMKPRTFSFLSRKSEEGIKSKLLVWLPADVENIPTEILMPNGEIIKGLGEPELSRVKEDGVVYFEKLGFAKLHKKENNKLVFWFAHA